MQLQGLSVRSITDPKTKLAFRHFLLNLQHKQFTCEALVGLQRGDKRAAG